MGRRILYVASDSTRFLLRKQASNERFDSEAGLLKNALLKIGIAQEAIDV